tara:strand:- start:450 stop:791 length:342 start_codon:yes stop_codon:yes gene_type:complete
MDVIDLTEVKVMCVKFVNGNATGFVPWIDKCFVCMEPSRYRCCDCRSGCFGCVQQWGQIRDTCGACKKRWVLRLEKKPIKLQGTVDEVWDKLQEKYGLCGLVMRTGNLFEQYV